MLRALLLRTYGTFRRRRLAERFIRNGLGPAAAYYD
jgi:hypothetical protein